METGGGGVGGGGAPDEHTIVHLSLLPDGTFSRRIAQTMRRRGCDGGGLQAARRGAQTRCPWEQKRQTKKHHGRMLQRSPDARADVVPRAPNAWMQLGMRDT